MSIRFCLFFVFSPCYLSEHPPLFYHVGVFRKQITWGAVERPAFVFFFNLVFVFYFFFYILILFVHLNCCHSTSFSLSLPFALFVRDCDSLVCVSVNVCLFSGDLNYPTP